jgi:hypothetical protein
LILYQELVVGFSAQQIWQSLTSYESRECNPISIHGVLVIITGLSKIRMQGQYEEPNLDDLPKATAMLLPTRDIGRDFVSSTSPGET